MQLGPIATSTHNRRLAHEFWPVEREMQNHKQSARIESLAECVRQMLTVAVNHRRQSGIDREIDYSYHASISEYTAEDRAKIVKSDIYMGITENKCRALVSWLADILSNAEEKPYALKATPLADLPDHMKQAVNEIFREEIELNLGGDFDEDARLKDLQNLAMKHAQRKADESVGFMEAKIHDQFEQGGFRNTFDNFLEDLAWAPNAFIKAPVVRYKKRLKWEQGALRETFIPTLCIERVDPRHVYPSPDSTTTQDGAYLFEVKRMLPHQLNESKMIPGFSSAAIEKVLASNPNGYDDWILKACGQLDSKTGSVTDNEAKAPVYDVAVMYGRLPGKVLMEFGLPVNWQHFYECEVWLVDDTVIRCILNPHPLCRRPIHSCSFAPRPGSFWGRSLPMILRPTQRMANAAARALAVNMGFSSGPIVEYDADRLLDQKRINELHPYRMFPTEPYPMGGGHAAFRFSEIRSYSAEFSRIYHEFKNEADELSGIPAYVIGSPNVAGAGRTLGGLSLLMGNAAKGVKRVLSQVDKDVIEPMVEDFYIINMLYDPDKTIKADAQVVSRGAAGLLQRELSQARTIEVLTILTPYMQGGFVPPEGVVRVLRDVIKGLGYDADEVIPDPDRAARLAEQIQLLNLQQARANVGAQVSSSAPTQQPQFVNNPAGTPQLDGRSAPALGALQSLAPIPQPASIN